MNKTLVFSILALYKSVNDGSLTIVANDEVYNNVKLDIVTFEDKIHILSPVNKYIKLDDIIGIQFQGFDDENMNIDDMY